jgi:hypothetical protein
MQVQTQQQYWTATAIAATQKDPITIHGDDGTYEGHVNQHGEKHGQGTLKTDIYITGVVGDDNSHLMRWTEFSGNWENGVMHGLGVMRKMSGNGVTQVVYDGFWDNGVPPSMSTSHADALNDMDDASGHEAEPEYDDAYYDYVSDLPQRGDYVHSEEAS